MIEACQLIEARRIAWIAIRQPPRDRNRGPAGFLGARKIAALAQYVDEIAVAGG